jgi:hypothetical protein
MFPAGVPGVGLLLLRISIGVVLLLEALPDGDVNGSWRLITGLLVLAGALLIGICTPVTCILSVRVQFSALLSARGEAAVQSGGFALITISTGLLGPGAFSVYALLFGRRLIPPPNGLQGQ